MSKTDKKEILKSADYLQSSKVKLKTVFENSEFAENIINTVREPLLVLDKDLRVLKASRSFFNFFKVNSEETIGRLIYDLGNKQWNIPKLRELLETILPEKTSFDDFEVEHKFSSIGKRVMLLNARQIKGVAGNEKIILLAIEDITERKLAEVSLTESNRMTHEYLDILFNRAHVPIIIWNSSFIITHINQAFENLCGYKWDEIKNKNIDLLFWEDNAHLTFELIKKIINSEKTEIIEMNILTKNKEVKTILWNSTNIFDKEGEKVVATIAQDITNRKKSEDALSLLETRYRRLFESAKDGILILDANTGHIIDVNPFLIDLLKSSKEKLVDKELWEIGFFNDIAANKEKFLELQKKEYIRYENLPLETTEDRKINVEFVSNVYFVNERKVIQCNIRDITERKIAEELLQETEERYRSFFENSMDGILLTRPDGKILSANRAACNMFGFTENELINLGRSGIVDTEDPNLSFFLTERAAKGKIQCELTFIRKDGTHFLCEISSAIFKNHVGTEHTSMIIRDVSERKQIQQEIKDSEEKFRIITENSADAIFIVNDHGKYSYVNTKAVQMLGYSNEEMKRFTIADISPEEKVEEYNLIFKQLLSAGFAIAEIELVAKDGNLISADFNAVLLPNGFIYASCRDISERIEIQNKIKFQAELLFNVGQAVIATDLLGKIIYWNHAAENIYGWTTDEALGENIIDLTPAEQTQKQASEIMKQLGVGNSWSGEFLVKRKNGSSFMSFVTDTPINDSNGNLIGVIGISSDVTEKKLAEDKIILLAHALKSINECVSITDIYDKIIFVNESFLTTYGYQEYEVLGKNMNLVRSVKSSNDLTQEILPSTIQGRWHGELWNKRKDGSEFLISLSTTSIYDKDNKLLGLIGVAKDVTEIKLYQQELIKAKEKAEQSDNLKSEFLAQMSHEIRTPLNAILGNVDYLNDSINDKMNPDITESFESIEIAAKRIIRTVDLILNTAELRTSGYQPNFINIDLDSEIFKKLFKEYNLSAQQKGLELTYICETEETIITADEYSITQIFVNLIDNAIKYTTKGKIEIILKKNTTDDIIVEIIDSGVGISEEFLPKLFDHFAQEEQGYTRSFEGNGLGLALVKSYCELNNIKIEVESCKNVGSTFRIIFKNL